MHKLKNLLSLKTFWWNLFIVILFCWFVLLRFLVITPQAAVHYHADFAIYINGEIEALADFSFYEEVSACSEESAEKPTSRVHLHDDIPSVIHIHDGAATYGHLMANLGFSLSDRVLETRLATYVDGRVGELRFLLNGEFVREIANRQIQSEDVLLIDFGQADPSLLQTRYDQIPRLSKKANQEQDPQSCSGQGETASLWQRLREALSF